MTAGSIPPAALPDALFALTFALLVLATLAIAGLALINTGLGRARSAAQFLLGCIVLVSVSAIVFTVAGASLADGGTAVVLQAAGRAWNWAGHGPLLLRHLGSSPGQLQGQSQPDAQLGCLFETLLVALACLAPWGAGADRWRLASGAAAAALLGVLVLPLAAHWASGAGWLAALGVNFAGMCGFVDGAGASLQFVGGLAALAAVWIAGPRKGKFARDGFATALPGHNAVYVLFGCLPALAGWMALNVAGAVLWLHAQPADLAIVALNTLLAAAGALMATLVVTRLRFGKPDASLCANGWMAGLVTSSACAGLVRPGAALFTGIVMGIATPLLVEVLELALSLDDPTGSITVHGCGGAWGLLAAGLFGPGRGQVLAQIVGIAALAGVFLPLLYGLFWLLDKVAPFRVQADGERIGMDLHELGGSAYPEFVLHRDDTYR